jgi:hypothetical protein
VEGLREELVALHSTVGEILATCPAARQPCPGPGHRLAYRPGLDETRGPRLAAGGGRGPCPLVGAFGGAGAGAGTAVAGEGQCGDGGSGGGGGGGGGGGSGGGGGGGSGGGGDGDVDLTCHEDLDLSNFVWEPSRGPTIAEAPPAPSASRDGGGAGTGGGGRGAGSEGSLLEGGWWGGSRSRGPGLSLSVGRQLTWAGVPPPPPLGEAPCFWFDAVLTFNE